LSDCAQGSEPGNIATGPSPPEARSGPATAQPVNRRAQPRPGGCRATVRDALDAALHGIRLGRRDKQFLRRLVHWDKRNAAAVASLLQRARQAGRSEAALSASQLEIVLTALKDAGVYRTSGAATMGCWDCENIPGGRCADHARDPERARACTELAAQLAAGVTGPAAASGFRRQRSVAS
jgi:hypothetical protein